jgi:anaerobic selenocysteine-containing dehydrogenase
MEVKLSFCRNCGSMCPIKVTVEDNRAIRIEGDKDAPIYNAFICPKARLLPAQHAPEGRILHSLKRLSDGRFEKISSDQAVLEIAERLSDIIDRHGPQSVAAYLGGGLMEQPLVVPFLNSFMQAIGSGLVFSAGTVDQPGLMLANALHGQWQGGRIHPSAWESFLVVGGNPVISKQHLPQNPGQQLKTITGQGCQLIVIDPRHSETARRAAVHLQLIPGEDPTVLAGLIHLIFAMDGVDHDFLARHVEGVEALREATRDFTADYVAARAGVEVEDLVAAAKILVSARKGDTALGVGPSMATRGTLTSYLALCIQSLRGFWAREGDLVGRPRVLIQPKTFRAHASKPRPAWGFAPAMGSRGLQPTSAGLPAAAIPEMMLSDGEDRIRAFFLHASPTTSWPERAKTEAAFGRLDLLVVHDVQMTPSSGLAHYVIATKRQLEVPVTTQSSEATGRIHPGYDWTEPYGAYRPAVLAPPAGSDLLESWQTYYRVAQKMGLSLKIAERGQPVDIAMDREPTSDEILELACQGSVVPLSRVKEYPHGHVFEEARAYVQAGDPTVEDRLQIADPAMMKLLREVRGEAVLSRRKTSDEFPFLMIARRVQVSTNSGVRPDGIAKANYNPCFMHPTDMEAMGLKAGDMVEVRSRHGAITSIVEPDQYLRAGVIGIAHGYGPRFGQSYDPRRDGANVNDLTHWEDDNDPYHGMPRMSALPVAIRLVESAAGTRAAAMAAE